MDDVDPLPALRRLAGDYYASGNTVKLASVMEQWLVLEPNSASVKNNLALAWLLLQQNLARAHELAAQALAAAPTNDAFRSTYIYSLLVQNKNREARAELDKLAVKNQPAGALYAALAYQAAGEAESARQALQRAGAGKLLPEEKKLHQQLYERLFP
jgi:tetratricopeptide (TPR) repeat protein